MTEKRGSRGLEQVYGAKNPDELAKAYTAWSADYDRETLQLGYCLPFVITAWLARHLPQTPDPILDAGCGTGLSGPFLKALGYGEIEGLDLSDDMLKLAEACGAYKTLKRALLGERLPWADDHFAAFIASGIFTEGHAPAVALEELVRITRPGGYGVFTVRDKLIEGEGFQAVFDRLESGGKWELVEKSAPFRAFAIAEPDVFVHSFVFHIL